MSAISSLAERMGMTVRSPDPPVLTVVPDVEEVSGPRTLKEVVGQDELRVRLNMRLEASVLGGFPLPHILLMGDSGLGKSSLAAVIAREAGMTLRVTTARACRGRGLAMLLGDLAPNTIVFIDEIHDMPLPDQEALGLAMVDWHLYLPAKGTEPPVERDIEPFVLIGATTLSGKLSKPLLTRFDFRGSLKYYSTGELADIITTQAQAMNLSLNPEAALALASRSRGAPRTAGVLLKALRSYVTVVPGDSITVSDVEVAMEVEGIDSLGLDDNDRIYLEALTGLVIDRAGTAVGIAPLVSCCVGLDRKQIENIIEPWLLQAGLIKMTDRGRVTTEAGFRHCRPHEKYVPIFLRRTT